MRSKGATSPSFETIVASGERSALPHGVASDRIDRLERIREARFRRLLQRILLGYYANDRRRQTDRQAPRNL